MRPIATEVLIIGAGISGIGAAIRLREQGETDFIVLEKAQALGGTWRDNTYPGCACDVPSALYSYSFAQNPRWSKVFAGQAEILDYVNDVAARFQVEPHIRYGEPATSTQWDERRCRWVVRTERAEYHARVIISCAGYLHEPQIPDIPGLPEFNGKIFHSSHWDHQHDLRGERVAVIGTGASAIQFVPQIQPQVKELVLFQRTPQWILPKPNQTMGATSKTLLGLPFAMSALRGMLYSGLEVFGVGFRRPALLRQIEKIARAHINLSVKDPALRAKLTPDYTLGCKRVLLSNDYYPALCQPNVDVLATGVKAVRGNVLIGQDGSEREVDTIILGTGFHVSDPPIAEQVRGTDGRTLAEIWNGSPQAYRGTTIAGFPNLFLVLGPNLAIGNNSAFIVIESQLNYAMGAIKTMREKSLVRIEVREAEQRRYNSKVQDALQGTVWNTGGCSSYYIDRNGKNSIGFPWSSGTMQRLLKNFDVESYQVQAVDEQPFMIEEALSS
ncbi:MAG: cyclohexanone monooxygenase [Gammaproteobacteria bacterium HGW-Gammaproteobacteria-14]|nr:MAG: cyclohexanone monooxygenase [Gammaproteobacteria bacterium HGW-Gammaproteobacteria-14]